MHDRLREYASFHAAPGNRACHGVGIPLIMVALFGLLGRVRLGSLGELPVTAAELLIATSLVYYVRVDAVLAALMVPVVLAMDALARFLPVWLLGAFFVVGWIFQLVGHVVYEKKSPAFLQNVVHLLIGPLFLLAKAVRRA
jgi:uncharacterized membrane protein YGL010W